jgi:hypothetical protein
MTRASTFNPAASAFQSVVEKKHGSRQLRALASNKTSLEIQVRFKDKADCE